MEVYNQFQDDPKRPIDWLKVTLIVIVFMVVLGTAIIEAYLKF